MANYDPVAHSRHPVHNLALLRRSLLHDVLSRESRSRLNDQRGYKQSGDFWMAREGGQIRAWFALSHV